MGGPIWKYLYGHNPVTYGVAQTFIMVRVMSHQIVVADLS
jgi:hypothetical protein